MREERRQGGRKGAGEREREMEGEGVPGRLPDLRPDSSRRGKCGNCEHWEQRIKMFLIGFSRS